MNLGRVDNHGFEAQATLQALTRRNFTGRSPATSARTATKIKDLGGVPSLITAYGRHERRRAIRSGPLESQGVSRPTAIATTGLATNVLCATASGKGGRLRHRAVPLPRHADAEGHRRRREHVHHRQAACASSRSSTSSAATSALSTVEIARCTGIVGAGLCRANYYPNEYDIKYLAAATTAAFAGNYVDQYFTSASFVKLREVSATYTIPERWVRGTQTSFTLAARELHTWTNFRGIDPEAFVGTSAIRP